MYEVSETIEADPQSATEQAHAENSAREAKAEEIRIKAFSKATGEKPKEEPDADSDGEDKEDDVDRGDSDDPGDGSDSDDGRDDRDGDSDPKGEVNKSAADGGKRGAVAVLAGMSEEERERYVLARRALKRDGVWDDNELDALDPKKVIEKGEKRIKVQHDNDRLGQRFGELDRRMKALEAGRRERTRTELDDDDFDGELEPPERSDDGDYLDDTLGEERDDKQPKRGQPGRKDDRSRADHNRELIRLQNELIVDRLTAAEQKIAGEFPELRNRATRDAVIARMSRMDPDASEALKGLGAVTDLMRDAALIVIGPQLAEQNRRATRERAEKAVRGQPDIEDSSRGDSSSRGARKPDRESIYRAAFKASSEETLDESRKKFRRLMNG